MTMKIALLHAVTPCGSIDSYQRFGGISCRYLQGNRLSIGMLHIGVMAMGVDVVLQFVAQVPSFGKRTTKSIMTGCPRIPVIFTNKPV